MKSIEVIINADGEIKIEAVGFTGGACEKATAELEKALGTVCNRKRKTEFYQQGTQNSNLISQNSKL